MSETQREEPAADKSDAENGAAPRSEPSPALSGMEINLGDFTRTQGVVKALRLMLNNQIVVQVEEVASGILDAGRKFKVGDLEQAHMDVSRLYASFGQRVNQWENQARNLEQQMKMQAAKNPKSISIDAMNRMKSEQTAVRTRIRTAEVQFRRLHQGLDQAYTNIQRQPVATNAASAGLSADFLASFQAATPADRPQIVKDRFEIEAVLKAHVSRGANGGYDIKFEPLPPLDRLYFFIPTAKLIRLEQLSPLVLLQDVETGQQTEMKLSEFVRHVQSGAWLLRPRADES